VEGIAGAVAAGHARHALAKRTDTQDGFAVSGRR